MQLTISAETHAKLVRARDLMRHRQPDGNLASVVDRALDTLLEKLERERLGRAKRPRTAASPPDDPGDISRAARRAVFERDGEQCTFRGPDGERCTEKAFLELDHVAMRTLGGGGQPANLRVLCGAHNRHLAEKLLGKSHVPKRARGLRKAMKSPEPTGAPKPTSSTLHEYGDCVEQPRVSPAPASAHVRPDVESGSANHVEPVGRGSLALESTRHAAAPGSSAYGAPPPEHDGPKIEPGPVPATALDSHDTSGGECARVRSASIRRRRSNDAPGSTDEDRAVCGLTNMGFRRPSCIRVVRTILDRGDTALSLSALLHEAIGTLAAER